MSTLPTALQQSSWLRPKYLLFAAIGLMLAYVIPYDESFLGHPKDPMWQHYEPFKWWLWPHGIAGACALLLGPMQFSDRLRDHFRQFHRIVGRIYVAGVFVAEPLGFYIQYFQERMGDPRSFSVAAAVDAALWMITTAIAMVFILERKVQEHRQWMTRSFAVAIVFLEVRVIGGVTGLETLDTQANETIVWACLAFSILSADLVLQWQQLGHLRSVVRCGIHHLLLSGCSKLHWAIRQPLVAVQKGSSVLLRLGVHSEPCTAEDAETDYMECSGRPTRDSRDQHGMPFINMPNQIALAISGKLR